MLRRKALSRRNHCSPKITSPFSTPSTLSGHPPASHVAAAKFVQLYQNTHLSRYDARAWDAQCGVGNLLVLQVSQWRGRSRRARSRRRYPKRKQLVEFRRRIDKLKRSFLQHWKYNDFCRMASLFGSDCSLASGGVWILPGASPLTCWTNIPLIALAILSIGPSVCAVILYSAYKSGLIQPNAPGYRFGSFVYFLPVDFALLNWAFVPLYVVGRIRPRAGSARVAMWFAVVAMSVPNVVLFGLAPEMVSNARDAGQGIGIIEAVLLWSPIQMIWPIGAIIDDVGFEVSFVLHALTGFLPILGLVVWLLGQLAPLPPKQK